MITFSGIDCSGKSTQIDIIKKHYDDKGIKAKVIWSRGGYTSWIEAFKTWIRRDRDLSNEEKEAYRESIHRNPKKAKLLLWASIIDLIRFYGIVFWWLELKGTTIICDRYIWDTYIDFKLKYREFDFENWKCWKILLRCMKKPEHSIIFVIPAELSMKRSSEKFEPFPETLEQRKVRIEAYMAEIKANRWENVIDGALPKEKVTEKVLEIIGL